MSQRKARVAVAVGSLVLAGLLGELILRALGGVEFRDPRIAAQQAEFVRGLHRPSSVPGLEYELTPDYSFEYPTGGSVHTNAHGLRGAEVTVEKPDGVFRIAAVGDSFTFGSRVDDTETFPRILEELLNAEGSQRYEVLNFGVAGYSTRDEVVVFRERVLAFAPDLVLIGYVLNDPEEHPTHDLHRFFHQTAWWEHLDSARLIAGVFHRRRMQGLGYEDTTTITLRYLHEMDGPYWKNAVRGFQGLHEIATESSTPTVLFVFPILSPKTWKQYPFADMHELVITEAEQQGLSAYDLLPPLRARAARPLDLKLEDDSHASGSGNRIIAEAIRDALRAATPELLPTE